MPKQIKFDAAAVMYLSDLERAHHRAATAYMDAFPQLTIEQAAELAAAQSHFVIETLRHFITMEGEKCN